MKRDHHVILSGQRRACERRTTVVKERMDLLELMRKRGVDGDVDFLREALRVLVEEIMEADVSSRTGAGMENATLSG